MNIVYSMRLHYFCELKELSIKDNRSTKGIWDGSAESEKTRTKIHET